LTPLRYPGGKARLAPYIAELIRAQRPRPTVYAEPFAGGAGAAIRLLADEVVDSIRINDLDPGIAALWRCIFNDTDELVRRVQTAKVTVAAWRRHRNIYGNPTEHDDRTLGFSTFFLNRCNRSGILNARPIGGLDQTGTWKIDARFNRQDLIERIRYLSEFRHRVSVSQLDARAFLQVVAAEPARTLVYVDPPYLGQGDDLYLDRLRYDDHQELAGLLTSSELRWFMTYDCDEHITDDLYTGLRCARFNIKHTAQRQHVGSEYAIYSDNLAVPSLDLLPRDEAEWVVV
jgi:DNA adenine methylase